MVLGSLGLRIVLALMMSQHIDSLLLFPEAFAMLVLQKAYGVSRAALVPAVCPREDELIEANSKLSLLSSIGGVLGGAMGVGLIALFGNGASTILAALVYVAGVVAALNLPQVQVAPTPVDETEKLEVRGANIVLAATAVAILRGIVGFTTFLLAFHLRAGDDGADASEPGSVLGAALGEFRSSVYDASAVSDLIGTPGPPQWHLGAAGLAAGAGAFLGAKFAPEIRNKTTEERIVFGAMITISIAAFLGGWGGGIQGTVVYAFGVAISSSVGKLGFDALVQRDAPRSNHGRAFAQFEGRFQLSWAIGAFVAVVGRFPVTAGAFLVALAAGLAAISYELGRRTDRVQASVRVREALLERVPQKTVDRIESHKAVQTVKPVFGRFARLGKSVFGAGASSVTAEPSRELSLPPPPPASSASSSPPPPPSPGSVPTSAEREESGTLKIPDPASDATIEARVPTGEINLPSVQMGSSETSSNDVGTRTSTSIDEVRWAKSRKPQVSGDGVWVSPEQDPEGGEGDDGQFRLWD